MKKTKIILAAMMICTGLTACGGKGNTVTETEGGTTTVEAVESDKNESQKEMTSAAKIEEKAQPSEESANQETKTEENEIKTQEKQTAKDGYEDNFEVEASVAAEFADKVKAAVAARDLEALADLTAFPVYVGIANGGVETREEFIALGADHVFTPELIASIEGADTSGFTPSMAGFSISKDGKTNIIFGVVDGRLAISGINY